MSGAEAQVRPELPKRHFSDFMRHLVRQPMQVGALSPSSRHLASSLVEGMRPGSRVIELGAGTGAVTRAILDAGVRSCDLTLVEKNEEFADLLEQHFPGTNVIRANAVSLRHYLCPNTELADFVVSGLPLLLFPERTKLRLLSQIFRQLREDGCLYQFTYGVWCPISRSTLRCLGLEASLIKITVRNFPPAFTYRIARARALP